MRPDRVDTKLAAEYAKDTESEDFLSWLNAVLAPAEEARYRSLEETLPTLHVLGCARSGTTLLTQLLASHLDVGCINNLCAAFWAAPCTGIRLSKHLLGVGGPSTYESQFGRTGRPSDPHEFGYFWAGLLGFREMREPSLAERGRVDWARVRQVLLNMTDSYGIPVVFKSPMLVWYCTEILDVLPKTCFLWIRRDPYQNALSLLRARREFAGDETAWFSLKPPAYEWLKEESPVRQCAGQVVFWERVIKQALDRAGRGSLVELSYEGLCRTPSVHLERVAELLKSRGGASRFRSRPPSEFPIRELKAPTAAVESELTAALDEFSRMTQ